MNNEKRLNNDNLNSINNCIFELKRPKILKDIDKENSLLTISKYNCIHSILII